MARTSKAKSDQPEQSEPAPVAQPVVEKTKAPRTKKTTTSPAVVETTPVVATQPQVQVQPQVQTQTQTQTQAQAPADETVPESTEFSELSLMSSEFLTRLNKWVSEGNALKNEFKTLEKRWGRELKNAQKSKKRSKRGGNRSPSGFVKPTKISDELARFLEKPLGSEMARTEVTKEINNYIRAHSLQDKDNGRKIIPDAKLSGLLKISKDDELTYFNLQRYMSPHFPKTPKKTTTASD